MPQNAPSFECCLTLSKTKEGRRATFNFHQAFPSLFLFPENKGNALTFLPPLTTQHR